MAMTEKGSEVQQTQAMHDAQAILASINLDEMIAKEVEKRVTEKMAEEKLTEKTVQAVAASTRGQGVHRPPTYLKHYRCDTSPAKAILRRKVDKDNDRLVDGNAKGWLRFRRGHFFAITQDEVDQLDWMMSHPYMDPYDPDRILGGDPSIYVDDGNDIVVCCGQYFAKGSNSHLSHIRAKHGG